MCPVLVVRRLAFPAQRINDYSILIDQAFDPRSEQPASGRTAGICRLGGAR